MRPARPRPRPQYECRLCLTLHTNEGNYLAHTQGKRHQQNLAKRAARDAAERPVAPAPQRRFALRKTVRIGRPGYRVTKQYDPEAGARSLLFQVGAGVLGPSVGCEGCHDSEPAPQPSPSHAAALAPTSHPRPPPD